MIGYCLWFVVWRSDCGKWVFGFVSGICWFCYWSLDVGVGVILCVVVVWFVGCGSRIDIIIGWYGWWYCGNLC